MEKGRTGRLFAELAVIVVGVLVALWADRWVQSLDDGAREQTYLEGLVRDLQEDSLTLVAAIEAERARAEMAGEILRAVGGRAADVEHPALFVSGFERVAWSTPLNHATATWSELLSRGDLGLVDDPDLRRSLSRHYEKFDNLSAIEADWERFFWNVETRTRSVNPAPVRAAAFNAVPASVSLDRFTAFRPTPSDRASRERPGGVSVPDSIVLADVERVLAAIRADDEFENLIGHSWLLGGARAAYYEGILADTNEMLGRVRSALAN